MHGKVLRSSDQGINAHPPGDPLPVPDSDPIPSIHQTPKFLQYLQNTIAVPQTSVASDCTDRVPGPVPPVRVETCNANEHAWYQQQGLGGVGRAERFKNCE